MHERDPAGEPGPRCRVEQLDLSLPQRGQRLGDVRGVEAQMVEPLAALGQEASDARRVVERLDQLDLALAGREQRGAYALVGQRRLLDQRQPQGVAVEAIGVLQTLHDDANVVNPSHHAQSLLNGWTARLSWRRRRGSGPGDWRGAWAVGGAPRSSRARASRRTS